MDEHKRSRKQKRFRDEEMYCSDEWKSLFPISAVFKAPLLYSARPILGPLVFNPIPTTRASLLSSPSLLPPSAPLEDLTLPRFLQTSSTLPSSAFAAVASALTPHCHRHTADFLHNRIETLRCRGTNNFVVFFPTGENSDRVGFLLCSVRDSRLVALGHENGNIFSAGSSLNHRILRISVNPVADSGSSRGKSAIGYLLAYTMYSVHWFVVKLGGLGSYSAVPSLVYVGTKVFKTCCVMWACWSPHFPEESIVLLESGALFLFDLEPWLEANNLNPHFKGTRLKVSWDQLTESRDRNWVGCEFSWHPRILVVACSEAVFVVDLRHGHGTLSCLMKIETLRLYAPIEDEQFLTLARECSDGFRFALVSDSLLVVCDVRKPMMPVLQWAHGLAKPSYVNVFRLSDLRSNSKDDSYNWASESGFCVVTGSFWLAQFKLFCYGPSLQAQSGKLLHGESEFCEYYRAWESPSNLLLCGNECLCGSCLLNEEALKDSLPPWIEWQYKKEVVLGFSIISKDLSSLLSEPDECGSFTLVRLMSSGKLESQRYSASWDAIKKFNEAHKARSKFDDYLMCYTSDQDHQFPRKFMYLELTYLSSYLDSNLDQVLESQLKNRNTGSQGVESFTLESHQILCEKLNACGICRDRTSGVISVVFKDIGVPSSIHEVALRRMWAHLPIELLQLAFSCYSEFLEVCMGSKRVPLEFSAIPDRPQLPPFLLRNPSCRSNKWSQKVPCPLSALAGPVLPLPILLSLNEFRYGSRTSKEESGGRFRVEAEYRLRFDEVMKMAREMASSESISELRDGHAVSLGDNTEEMLDGSECGGSQTVKPFVLHKQRAFNSDDDHMVSSSVSKEEVFRTLISKVVEKDNNASDENVGVELFDSLCPIQLRFDDSSATKFGNKEFKAYKLLKKQFSKWQADFDLYQEFCSSCKLRT